MPRRAALTEPNIRATASPTLFYIDNHVQALADWLCDKKGMEREAVQNLGRHYAVLSAPRMELVIDAAAMSGFQIRCLGVEKTTLAEWVQEFFRARWLGCCLRRCERRPTRYRDRCGGEHCPAAATNGRREPP
jgi:hypothetical protein